MKNSYRSILTVAALAIFTVSTATVQAGDYNYITNNGTITIMEYSGPGGDVTIPDRIEGVLVTSIGDSAFYRCTEVTNVTMGDTVTAIGHFAFYGCTKLTTIAIPKSVTSIGEGAISGCTSLVSITVDALNGFFISVDGVLFDKNQTTLIQCPAGRTGGYAIPKSVTNIADRAFSYCAVASITIRDSVTRIGNEVFSDCTSLSSITIPNSVTTIGGYAFYDCYRLTSVAIPNSVTSIGDWAFRSCTSLTNVIIGNSVVSIGYSAFSDCTSLTSVYFRGNAPSLGGPEVFYDANNATVWYIPGTIGWSATFGGRPTAPWLLPYPVILTTAPNFGIQTNAFGFRISWATNASVVVEATADLSRPSWDSVSTNTLVDGWSDFRDAEWTKYPARFYRVRQW